MDVTIEIRGLTSYSGEIYLAVFNSKKGFPENSKSAYLTKVYPCSKYIIASLPIGTYAFALFQDLNANKILDKNLVGYPKEPFGFSNDPSIGFSAPSFNECKVLVNQSKNLPIVITLK